MRALKLQVHISDPSRLVVHLPPGVARGDAELILLPGDDDGPMDDCGPAWDHHLTRALSGNRTRSRSQIDAELSAERSSWD